jgi:hypothetical protein
MTAPGIISIVAGLIVTSPSISSMMPTSSFLEKRGFMKKIRRNKYEIRFII